MRSKRKEGAEDPGLPVHKSKYSQEMFKKKLVGNLKIPKQNLPRKTKINLDLIN